MRNYTTPAWFKEFKKREKAGDSGIRERLTATIMEHTGWPKGTVRLILRGYGMHSPEINHAAEVCLGMDGADRQETLQANRDHYEELRDRCRLLPALMIRLRDGDIGKRPLSMREKAY